VCFTGDFVLDCPSNCLFCSSNFNTAFLADCTNFCCVFSACWIGNLIRIRKMCLKLLISYSKWVLHAFLSLTVLSNCLSGSSNFHTAFLADCTNFCCVFSGCCIGNLIRIPKMCLKLKFSHCKCVLQAILSLTVL